MTIQKRRKKKDNATNTRSKRLEHKFEFMDYPYRHRQYKVHTPIRISFADIADRSSHAYANIFLRDKLWKCRWLQNSLRMEKLKRRYQKATKISSFPILQKQQDKQALRRKCPGVQIKLRKIYKTMKSENSHTETHTANQMSVISNSQQK